MPWDFDIIEVAKELKIGYGLPYICEGFGFTYIAKNEEGDILLAFPDYVDELYDWKTYEEVING